ncbi:hypothetical protein B0H10DRAFT_1946950 [Mycena sp. CBHHK59/15]|nr:hypothetical protein B0H10DRAFT_1946950 [Mycena sp. CBHHK59/15]
MPVPPGGMFAVMDTESNKLQGHQHQHVQMNAQHMVDTACWSTGAGLCALGRATRQCRHMQPDQVDCIHRACVQPVSGVWVLRRRRTGIGARVWHRHCTDGVLGSAGHRGAEHLFWAQFSMDSFGTWTKRFTQEIWRAWHPPIFSEQPRTNLWA